MINKPNLSKLEPKNAKKSEKRRRLTVSFELENIGHACPFAVGTWLPNFSGGFWATSVQNDVSKKTAI